MLDLTLYVGTEVRQTRGALLSKDTELASQTLSCKAIVQKVPAGQRNASPSNISSSTTRQNPQMVGNVSLPLG